MMKKRYDPYQDMLMGKISPGDLDAMRQAIEDMAGASFSREFMPVFTEVDVIEARKGALAQIEKLQNDLKRYDEIVEFINTLPFKEGDAAFHKDHGNVLVYGVSLNENLENSVYSVVLKTGKRLQVKFDELMPISEATKVLFGKK